MACMLQSPDKHRDAGFAYLDVENSTALDEVFPERLGHPSANHGAEQIVDSTHCTRMHNTWSHMWFRPFVFRPFTPKGDCESVPRCCPSRGFSGEGLGRSVFELNQKVPLLTIFFGIHPPIVPEAGKSGRRFTPGQMRSQTV
jgi:hypothetical protein